MTKTPHEPQAVWETLKRGNARFRDHISEHPHADTERRYALRSGQAPRAVVLACSDSRVPVELVFDCGLGDLFVVRTAGEILDSAVLGSIEFAVPASASTCSWSSATRAAGPSRPPAARSRRARCPAAGSARSSRRSPRR